MIRRPSRRLLAGVAALALLGLAGQAAAQTLAFPGAEGAGRFSQGGRGGAVIKVTNLNDAGPGSLRAAVEAKGPRTVVFEVAGTIQLKSDLKISQPRITIAGQTAPGGGITLRDHTLVVSADDVVIRFIRSRLGDESKTESDAIWINNGRRIILDHVSASWSVDETLSASARYGEEGQGFFDLTVQWSIIAESMARSLHAKGDHGYGSLIRGGMLTGAGLAGAALLLDGQAEARFDGVLTKPYTREDVLALIGATLFGDEIGIRAQT